MICREREFAGEMMGAPCQKCGHTNVVHPGYHNPKVLQCVICALEDAIRVLREQIPL